MKILIIGGNRFFGLHLTKALIRDGHAVTLLNRGQTEDGLGTQVQRVKADRKSLSGLKAAVGDQKWDVVYDQVCYTAEEARIACEVFNGKTDRYIVTSSESVYDDGAHQSETAFDPRSYLFEKEVSPNEDYQEAKRQVEVVFTRSLFNEVVIVRPSLVVGTDDYTGRLKWHVDRVKNKQPIYFPNIEIESDFIRSDQAGEALLAIGLSKHVGPINFTTPGAISMKRLIQICEKVTGQTAIIASAADDENHSPYGGEQTKTMDTRLLSSLGVKLEPSHVWLEELIHELVERS